MRTWIKSCVAQTCEAAGGLERLHAGKLVVLTFHRVRPEGEDAGARAMRGLEVLAGDFRRILLWMRERYEPMDLRDWLEGERAPERASFAVTFDDGWADNYEHGYPILRELGIPATIFLSTGAVEDRTPFWWQAPGLTDADIEEMKKRPAGWKSQSEPGRLGLRKGENDDFLRWEQVEEMAQGGLVAFGPHGHGHGMLDQVSREEALEDVERCAELISRHVPQALAPALAWPNGNGRFDLGAEFEALGLRAAFGTRRGAVATPIGSRWDLPRNNVDRLTSRTPGLLPWMLMKAR
jgi:peptidoglycan/xylan/chitin deacetylase (PgdA/CDA1 family)